MAKLVSRQKFTPAGGFLFYQPEIKWQAPPHASFDTTVRGLITARMANPVLMARFKWATDYNAVANEVDAFNAAVCEKQGWKDYIMGSAGTGPFTGWSGPPPRLHSLQNVAAGVRTIAEMFGPEGPCDAATANARARVCVPCPLNDKAADWTGFFTAPAAAVIRKMLGLVKDLDLRTDLDDKLVFCKACSCPLRTKVWARLPHILANIPPDAKARLDPGCWIRTEQKQ